MGEHKKSVESIDPKTGEAVGFDINITSIVADVRDILLAKRKMQTQATVWSKMSEMDQADEIREAVQLAYDVVDAVVDLVAAGGNDVIHAKLDNFKVKDGAVTVTAKGIADDAVVVSLNQVGHKNLKIIVADAAQHDMQHKEVKPDKDQPDLLPEDDASGDQEPDGEISDEDVGAIAADMDEAADAMDEPEDLHEHSEKWHGGFGSRMGGYARNRNPLDVDENEGSDWLEWNAGWDAADAEISGGVEGPAVDESLGAPEVSPADGAIDEAEPETVSEEPVGDVTKDDAPDLGGLTIVEHAQKVRLADGGPDDNPFDGGTDEHIEWAEVYAKADEEVQGLIQSGYDDFKAGKTKKSGGGWKAKTDGLRFWTQGWVKAEAEASEANADAPSEPDPNDSTAQGRAAAERGEARDANPNPEGGTKYRFWNEGWDSFDQPED